MEYDFYILLCTHCKEIKHHVEMKGYNLPFVYWSDCLHCKTLTSHDVYKVETEKVKE